MTNRFKSSQFCGVLENIDYPDGSIQASAIFNRNATVKGDLNLGKQVSEYVDGSIIYTNTGGNINYSIAGTNYTISPTELTQLKETLATETFVTDAIDAIPPTDFTGYATISYVDTAVSGIDLSGLATETYVDTAVSGIDLTGLATETYVDTAVSGIDLTGLATETYVDTAVSGIDLTGLATETYVDTAVSGIDLTGLATETYVDTAVSGIDLTGYATETYVNTAVSGIDLTGYATETFVTDAIAGIPPTDLTGYATETYVTSSISAIPPTDLSAYATNSSVVKLTGNQTIAGIKTFSSNPIVPDLTFISSGGTECANKNYVDERVSTKASLSQIQNNNNDWQGTNQFNYSLPTSSLTPSSSSQLVTKSYVDTAITGLSVGSYALDASAVHLTGNETISGIKTFNSSLIIPDVLFTDTNNQKSVNKAYVDERISSLVSTAPSTLDTLNELATALGNDPNFATTMTTNLAGKTTLSAVQANNNVWTGTNTFDTNLPTSTITPSSSTQLVTKTYVDTQVNTKTSLSSVQSNNNTWTGTNVFNTSLPTSTVTPSSSTQLVTKTYVDTQVATKTTISGVTSNNNTWTGTNAFNTSLPTSSLTPSAPSQLVTKTYADSLTTNLLANTNTWSGTSNTFNLALNARLIDSDDGTLNNNLYSQTTTGTTTICNNQTGNLVIGKIVSAMYIGNQSTGTIGIASGTGATAQVNIGQSNGSNIVNIGAFRFSGNNITLSSAFTTPSSGQIGYTLSTGGTNVLTSGSFITGGACSLSLSPGIWFCNVASHFFKTTNTTSTTTQLTETITAISTDNGITGSNNNYIRNNLGTSTASGFTFPTGNANRQTNSYSRVIVVTSTTTYYVAVRAVFSLASGDTLSNASYFTATRIA